MPESSHGASHLNVADIGETFVRCQQCSQEPRIAVAETLSKTIRTVLSENSKRAWELLLNLPYKILHTSTNIENSLTSKIKSNCTNETIHTNDQYSLINSFQHDKKYRHRAPFKLVESRIADGDLSGAARLLFSEDKIASNNAETLATLKDKHPPSATDLHLPEEPNILNSFICASKEDVLKAINSFRPGSAGGLDGLTPQHLKDLTSGGNGHAGEILLQDLTALINLMLSGRVHNDILDVLYGANLCALKKKDGGIRPIAVGTTYRRLAAKICCTKHKEVLKNYLQPVQLGFGTQGGCEAAVHALRTFLDRNSREILLKVDVRNTFNSIDRGALLTQIKENIPNSFGFLWQCYSTPTKLMYKNNLIDSAVGCQQGDPLGPAIFSLAIHPIITRLNSKFNMWYLDDGTLGGDADTVMRDLKYIISEFESIGLHLNLSKCELYIPPTSLNKDEIIQKFNLIAPNITTIDDTSLRLLGSPVKDKSIPSFINDKIQNFNSCSDRLLQINSHMAFWIIKFCLFVPKFTHFLRCCQFWKHPIILQTLDDIVKNTLINVLNIDLQERIWTQATLPVRFGGLGVRKISSVALPAFLSSVHSTKKFFQEILHADLEPSLSTEARNAWLVVCPGSSLPIVPSIQRSWDGPICELSRKKLLETSISSADRARLLATTVWESGLWLQALPSPSIGTLMDAATFRSAICLRLGANCCEPHNCRCGRAVDRLGHHGLSCGRSAGRIPRHAGLNDIIRRALVSADVPAVLEPNGLIRNDGKRPDGMTLIPWSLGRPLVWDVTCVDTLAPSHLQESKVGAGRTATSAENLKRLEYQNGMKLYLV
ncbi:hypothetical protein K1T71_001795 [Dendrolimus kikuchii]|uniref:Uncharacterized protein n=1 Tax=Dendrolimus kikuchii TaxID=765133 RepID=A0ACC1DEY8_9NEOP|nr:hypothetical protein K1T71_001795 [Dendrolimus kikuchii]